MLVRRLFFNDLTRLLHSRLRRQLYRGDMDAKCLTADERAQLRRQVERRRDYLAKLVARMDALGFPDGDPVRVAAVDARDKVEAVLTAIAAAAPPAPFLAHYGPSEPSATPRVKPEPWVWVGKRKSTSKRRR